MIHNSRVVLTPKHDPTGYDRFWCYTGNTLTDVLRVISLVVTWNDDVDSEPPGWNKNGQTGEWRGTRQ
jgi:hypothetical protein